MSMLAMQNNYSYSALFIFHLQTKQQGKELETFPHPKPLSKANQVCIEILMSCASGINLLPL